MALYVLDDYVETGYVQTGVTVVWKDKNIFVPRSEMLQVQTNPVPVYQLDILEFHDVLRDIEDGDEGISFPTTHSYSGSTTISGVVLAPVVEILEPYTITFEDGAYNVNIVGGNSNISDRTNKNQVGVNTANSAGLQDLSSLQAASFGDGAVAIDQVNGVANTVYPIGTRGTPSNNWTDARAIAESRNMSKVIVMGTAVAAAGDDISNLTVIGTNPMVSILVVYPEAVTNNLYIMECYFTGALDGGTILRNCVVGDITYFDGFIENSAIAADNIAIVGTGTFINCREGNKVTNEPSIDMTAGDNLFVRDYSGNLVIKNKTTAGVVEIKIDGQLTIDASCTDGTFSIYGDGYVVNNSGLTIEDKTTGTPEEIADKVWTSATRELTEGFDNTDRIKLNTLSNYDDSTINTKLNTLIARDAYSEASVQNALDTYINKDDWKASSVDLTPVLNAISALENLSLLDVEGSLVLAKEATLDTIVTEIAAISTSGGTADLTPVLTAISELNDVTAAEVRAAFNAAEFADKNTEAEIHAWLTSYTGKDEWKADISLISTDVGSVKTTVEGLVNYDDSAVVSKIDSMRTVVNAMKALVDDINVDMDALDANNVNSIYAKLVEVSADIDGVLNAANNVPQQTYELTFGKLV